MLFMNRQRYESLPAQARQAIDKYSMLILSRKFGEKTNEQWQKSRSLVQDSVTTLAPAEEVLTTIPSAAAVAHARTSAPFTSTMQVSHVWIDPSCG